MAYRFTMGCPRCGKETETTADQKAPPPHVNCGDCLMDDVEIVEMYVVEHERSPSPVRADLRIPTFANRNQHPSSDSVECPHCHWGFAPSVIIQHIREKH